MQLCLLSPGVGETSCKQARDVAGQQTTSAASGGGGRVPAALASVVRVSGGEY